MTQRDALETITTALVKAVLDASSHTAHPPRPRRHRSAPSVASGEAGQQMPLNLVPGPPPVPEFGDGAVAPPFTQAQFDAMERVLRGEGPKDTYDPESGQQPWKG